MHARVPPPRRCSSPDIGAHLPSLACDRQARRPRSDRIQPDAPGGPAAALRAHVQVAPEDAHRGPSVEQRRQIGERAMHRCDRVHLLIVQRPLQQRVQAYDHDLVRADHDRARQRTPLRASASAGRCGLCATAQDRLPSPRTRTRRSPFRCSPTAAMPPRLCMRRWKDGRVESTGRRWGPSMSRWAVALNHPAEPALTTTVVRAPRGCRRPRKSTVGSRARARANPVQNAVRWAKPPETSARKRKHACNEPPRSSPQG